MQLKKLDYLDFKDIEQYVKEKLGIPDFRDWSLNNQKVDLWMLFLDCFWYGQVSNGTIFLWWFPEENEWATVEEQYGKEVVEKLEPIIMDIFNLVEDASINVLVCW